ncbi:chemotaxis protein CheB [Pseudomonas sp. M30-35]|uniref:chemotaxis protein CheB n=1 Tax=Pseudomonas sp. M30-35 TaxID=1981174 RepID=UPI000B3C926E|nr:chemotaxis protein CheB [Pseudomonas sp. M30-35]ARU86529.1 chemotaxis protein CheB [Pseudomonas sp. M30-35]
MIQSHWQAALAKHPTTIEALVVGASAGGVSALLTIFANLPAHPRLPIAVVIHLPDNHNSALAEVMGKRLGLPAKEAENLEPLEAGTLYFAAPGYHLSIEADHSFSYSREEPVYFSRPSIDILFESAADAYGANLAGILLTGANQDGASGLATIKRLGGFTVVQDPQDAHVPTMPLAALALHQPDVVAGLAEIRALLVEMETA